MADKRKKEARDIQSRTGWKYLFCRRLIGALGYEKVSNVIDAESPGDAGDRLNEMMRSK